MMINNRKPFREQTFKSDASSSFTHRVIVGESYSAPATLCVEDSARTDNHPCRYSSDADLSIRAMADGSIQIEIAVASYTRNGSRRAMHHSMTLPADVAVVVADVLRGKPASEALALLPRTRTID